MGVGTPPDLLYAIGCGVDMFDCVLPTHLAWQGTAFTSTGRVRVTRGANAAVDEPLDARVRLLDLPDVQPRATCTTSSSAASRSGPRLLSVHNLHHYLDADARGARGHRRRRLRRIRARTARREIDRHEHAAVRAVSGERAA